MNEKTMINALANLTWTFAIAISVHYHAWPWAAGSAAWMFLTEMYILGKKIEGINQ